MKFPDWGKAEILYQKTFHGYVSTFKVGEIPDDGYALFQAVSQGGGAVLMLNGTEVTNRITIGRQMDSYHTHGINLFPVKKGDEIYYCGEQNYSGDNSYLILFLPFKR